MNCGYPPFFLQFPFVHENCDNTRLKGLHCLLREDHLKMNAFFLLIPILTLPVFSLLMSYFLQQTLAPLFLTTTALIGVLEFLLAIAGYLPQGNRLILGLAGMALLYLIWKVRQTKLDTKKIHTILIYLLGVGFIALFAWGMRFRSIDDYAFWGVMSKYLFTFNQLPSNDHYMFAKFLTFIPGMGYFHYFYYFSQGFYSQYTGYLAQGIVLLSALMVLYVAEQPRISLLKMAIAYVVLSIGFGTVFARMEVDAYVATYTFAIMWIIVNRYKHMLLLVSFPILFLSLIKEIGLLFALMCLVSLFLTMEKTKKNMLCISGLTGALLGLKSLWLAHCHYYGFHSFAHAVTFDGVKSALNPFNVDFHAAQWLFLKSVLLERFGHIFIPNILLYAGIFWLWRRLASNMQPTRYTDANRLRWVFVGTLFVYLILLYILQALVFGMGHEIDHLLDFQRYYNMLLMPFTLFSLLLLFQEKGMAYCVHIKTPLSIAIVAVALIFVVTGKIERTRRYYMPEVIYPMVAQVQNELPNHARWTLCLQNPPAPSYKIVMALSYFFMPNPVLLVSNTSVCNYVMHWTTNKTITLSNPA